MPHLLTKMWKTEPRALFRGFFHSVKLYQRLIAIVLTVVFLDQSTKLWIIHYSQMPLHNPPMGYSYWPRGGIEIIDNFFYLCHLANDGAAWGMLSGYGFWLGLLAIIVLIAIFYYRKELNLKNPWRQFCFGLIAGGIIGNLIDRMIYGHVIDFLDIHLPGYRWPAFNIADIGISTGLLIYLVSSWFSPISRESSEPSS